MWKKAKIMAKTAIGKLPVQGYALEGQGLGVHRDLNNNKYWIHTHIESGYSINHWLYATLKKAKKYAELMAETEIDWNLTGEELTAKYTDIEFRKIVSVVYYGEKK